jgi:ribosomal protein S14
MKKLLQKDKNLRLQIKNQEIEHLVLKSIYKNLNYFTLIRWNAFMKLANLSNNRSKSSLINRCVYSVNKKRFNKLTNFSRHIFLKLLRLGNINGVRKSSW